MRVVVHGTGVSVDDDEAFTAAIAAVERAAALRCGPEAQLVNLDHQVTLVETKGGTTFTYVTITGIVEPGVPPAHQMKQGSHRAAPG